MKNEISLEAMKDENAREHCLPLTLRLASFRSFHNRGLINGKSVEIKLYKTDSYPVTQFYKPISRMVNPDK